MSTENVSKEQKGNDANRVLATVIDSLSEAIEKANIKITFGIQDWQIKRIEEERERWNNIETGMTENVDMIYSIHFWDKLGKEFAWHPFTLALYYFQYLEECRSL